MKKPKRPLIPKPKSATNRVVLQATPFTDRQRSESFRLLCFISGITECLDALKGTDLYSKKLEDTLNAYCSTKGDKIYLHGQRNFVADITAKDLAMYTSFINRVYKVGYQPDDVVKRFADSVENAFIVAGVLDEDRMEALNVEMA